MRIKKTSAIGLSIVILLLGAILFIWPGGTLSVACRVIGAAFLITAAILLIGAVQSRSEGFYPVLSVAGGIILAVVGAIILANPKFVLSILPVLIGISITANGIINLLQTLAIRSDGSSWPLHLILAIVTIGLGILIIANPFSTMEMLVKVMGIILIYDGISNIVTAVMS